MCCYCCCVVVLLQHKQEEADEVKRKFAEETRSDHIALLRAFEVLYLLLLYTPHLQNISDDSTCRAGRKLVVREIHGSIAGRTFSHITHLRYHIT